MSWLTSWLSPAAAKAAAAPPVVDSLEAMDQLQAAMNGLQLRRMQQAQTIESKQAALQIKAKAARDAGKRELAVKYLKQSKALELPLAHLDGQIANLEHEMHLLESSATTAQTVGAMKVGAASAKQIIKTVDIDEIDTVHDDLKDAAQDMSIINDTLARPIYDIPEDEDFEDSIEKTLAQWDTDPLDNIRVPTHAVSSGNTGSGSGGNAETVNRQKNDSVPVGANEGL
jgi:Snf7